MSKFGLTVFLIALVAMFSSCEDCTTCDCSGDEQEICRNDYDSKVQYDAIVDLSESLGCECSN